MKNLANCNGIEFLTQTNKIRHEIEAWLKDTGVLKIRQQDCEYVEITEEMTDDQKQKALEENEKRHKEQARKNLSAMLDAALEVNAEKTFKILSMMCFLSDEEAKTVKASELLLNFAEMIADEGVLGFFSLLKTSGLLDFLGQ